jgi:hypothetical protein
MGGDDREQRRVNFNKKFLEKMKNIFQRSGISIWN